MAVKTGKFHYPLTVDGYRVVYKGYLADPDLQDARARWPFVAIWDNHEFSWQGRQSIVQAGGDPQPGQTVKVAANQAWFEYIPARVKAPSGSLDTFGALAVKNVPIEKWDDSGLGIEPNNLKAINSLIAYRSFALRPAPRSHSHRPAQLLRRRPDRCGGRWQDLRSGFQRDVL